MVAAIALEGANMALSGWRLFDGSSLNFSTLKKRLLLRLNLFKIRVGISAFRVLTLQFRLLMEH
jgi:hypothetical protein